MTEEIKSYCVWCQFSQDDTEFLNYIQNKVQSKLGGPEFEIHLTLIDLKSEEDPKNVEFIKKACLEFSTIQIFLDTYMSTENFFKAIFINVHRSQELLNLRSTFIDHSNKNLLKNFSPHVSLAYGNFKNSHKQNLMGNLPTLRNKLIIDKLCLVEVDERVPQWTIVKKFKLQSNNADKK